MLARSAPAPPRGDHAYELKWDGFRESASTEELARAPYQLILLHALMVSSGASCANLVPTLVPTSAS